MDSMAAIRQTFFEECEEQLTALEEGLQAMNEGTADRETVNAVFRAVHSIKGGAGAFKYSELVAFAHKFENVLDQIRSDRLVAGPEAMRIMLRAADVLADLVRLSLNGEPIADSIWTALAAELTALSPGGTAKAPASALVPQNAEGDGGLDFLPSMISFDEFPAVEAAPQLTARNYLIRFSAKPALYAKANEPCLLLRELARLGETRSVCDTSGVGLLGEETEPGTQLAWTVSLATDRAISEIRDVFEFVEHDCELSIEDLTPEVAAEEPRGLPETRSEILLDIFALPAAEPKAIAPVAPPAAANTAARPDHAAPQCPPHAPKQDSGRDGPSAAASAPQNTTIRVDLDRVDRLINLVGELVINQAMLTQRVIGAGFPSSSPVMIGLDELEHLTRDIQESVMAIRAQPVKPLFQRMSRIMREVCEATGKDVRLRVDGENTEVDKTVVERLADPLTHMIRNAVDHGIEDPQARLAAGKPSEGTVRLTAAHRSGRVVIEIADDGQGLNRKRILEKAQANGLVPSDAALTDAEIDNLLFLPGLTTAEAVSNISGRGVGMDVVKRSIQALGGRISIASTPGSGSVFTMSLPLTLAVLDGMIVTTVGQTLVVPLTAIVETLKPAPGSLHSVGGDSYVIKIRNTFVPIVDVGQRLGFRKAPQIENECVAILVESESGGRHALLVDAIQDQRQVVIKSLETNYGSIDGIAAATILGDGRVALILDVDAAVTATHGGRELQAFGAGSAAEVTLQ